MLKDPTSSQFSLVEYVGVAIRHVTGGHHLALLYTCNGAAKFLHLTNLHGVQNIEPEDKYCWLQCGLDQYNKLLVAALCQDISLKLASGKPVPYGFRFNGEYFDTTGGYIGTPTQGLTCSTFILAVFRTLKLELVAVDEWPPAGETDRFARMQIAAAISQQSQFAPDRLKDDWESPRFRPGQVAAATSADTHPLGYVAASRAGERVEKDLLRLRPK